ncbi:type II toxin-antitoxin system RelE/ParE family toxin [Cedecea davisae]|uniref:type II toxin-antitoxin system RelE/ParE family toxin n=1 Tax=Cedecea davisae TaxID=158484 RepID=UPI001D0AFBBB|nr:type II toxin-antitoxin system RelE/ParE family toxin [Cedecea davisae]
MIWTVIFTDYFYFWYQAQPLALRKRLAAAFGNIGFWGPELSRPLADTVKGSRYPNMKELRLLWCGKPYRIFFAFDPDRRAVVLCGGDKSGKKRFYQSLIKVADTQFALHLAEQEKIK